MMTNEQVAPDPQSADAGVAATGGRRRTDLAPPPATELSEKLEAYRRELRRWIEDPGSSESTLFLAGRSLCDTSTGCRMLPEQLLIALHPDGVQPWSSDRPTFDAGRESRYRWAIRLLLRTYFGLEVRSNSASGSAR